MAHELPVRAVYGDFRGVRCEVQILSHSQSIPGGGDMPKLIAHEVLLTMPTSVYRTGGMLHALTLM